MPFEHKNLSIAPLQILQDPGEFLTGCSKTVILIVNSTELPGQPLSFLP